MRTRMRDKCSTSRARSRALQHTAHILPSSRFHFNGHPLRLRNYYYYGGKHLHFIVYTHNLMAGNCIYLCVCVCVYMTIRVHSSILAIVWR